MDNVRVGGSNPLVSASAVDSTRRRIINPPEKKCELTTRKLKIKETRSY
jgi:hypothetical protein